MSCILQDCGHLVLYGETAETLQKHEWLHENAAREDEDQMRPRPLATAEASYSDTVRGPAVLSIPCNRDFGMPTISTLSRAIFTHCNSLYLQLLIEFDALFKTKSVESIENDCRVLCSLVLPSGKEAEVGAFSQVASGKFMLTCFAHFQRQQRRCSSLEA